MIKAFAMYVPYPNSNCSTTKDHHTTRKSPLITEPGGKP